MTFDMEKVLESKRAFRKKMASLPIAEKLKILDAMRERELQIRGKDKIGGAHKNKVD